MLNFADTADIDAIRDLPSGGLIDGVTTNPSLVAGGRHDFVDSIAEIAESVEGPASVEVAASDPETLLQVTRALRAIAPNVCVKLPLTWTGLKACHALNQTDAITNVPLCFSVNRALLAPKADVSFVSPFVGRLDDINLFGAALLRDIRTLFDRHRAFDTKILAASLRTVNRVFKAALIGCDAVTATPAVFEKLEAHLLTEVGLSKFIESWRGSGQRIPI